MTEFKARPTCDKVECFAYCEGYCMVLTKNDFGSRRCLFFKTKEQVAEEKEYCAKRLDEIRGKKEN